METLVKNSNCFNSFNFHFKLKENMDSFQIEREYELKDLMISCYGLIGWNELDDDINNANQQIYKMSDECIASWYQWHFCV